MVDIIFLGLNDIGDRVYEWLVGRDDANVHAILTEPDQLSLVERLEPDLVLSAGFRHIVPEGVLNVPELGAVNFHKSYLPYNRGMNPNVWSIIEDPPAGVSLHYMTPELDGGPLIDRREVAVRPEDDARDLYERLEEAQFEQFTSCWQEIRDGTADATEQTASGTYHYKEDFLELWELDPGAEVTVREFIDRLRALTFPPYKNAYFVEDGTRYHVEISIESYDEPTGDDGPEKKRVPDYSESGDE